MKKIIISLFENQLAHNLPATENGVKWILQKDEFQCEIRRLKHFSAALHKRIIVMHKMYYSQVRLQREILAFKLISHLTAQDTG